MSHVMHLPTHIWLHKYIPQSHKWNTRFIIHYFRDQTFSATRSPNLLASEHEWPQRDFTWIWNVSIAFCLISVDILFHEIHFSFQKRSQGVFDAFWGLMLFLFIIILFFWYRCFLINWLTSFQGPEKRYWIDFYNSICRDSNTNVIGNFVS